MLKDPGEYKRLITTNGALYNTIQHFPNHADALIRPVLNDPEVFKRLIKDNDELRYIAQQFPNHAEILGKGSREEALEELIRQINQDLKEISQHARLMGIFREQEKTTLKQLPPELAKKIIMDTRSSRYVSDEKADEEIGEEYKKGIQGPPRKK